MLTEVADGVLVHRSEVLRNNTVVVQGTDGVLVVDPGLTEVEMACLARDLSELGQPVVAGFATHPDWDHVLWYDELGDVPRYGTADCVAFMADLRAQPDWRDRVAEGLPPEIADETPLDLFGLLTVLPEGATELPWAGPVVRVVEHAGHATGHAALLVEGSGVLVAGDMLSDLFVPMLDVEGAADPVGDYLAGLARLDQAAERARVVVPGHGTVGTGEEVRLRLERDRAYVLALRDGGDFDDPRISTPETGWEWTTAIHEGQLAALARR
ncbi:MBL fold metallo-hydrolase [Nocardioides silvaticus]|uniref:MBL fold metallo-hydrolase n=1 Tax=Nocardioides silvaticus TaxID=2201891 RepID=A0A316TX61_9ACTN|nr:MBL fold metallo-hydrolase [Nocardioides silvaticus]PWN04216.1 MBL fold metallo-hydrolase [Nocardioides silvaticus]